MAEDASSKKFFVSNFTNYKMTYSRQVMEQYNELLGILGRFTQHKMNMDKAIQVSCIIDKLPPSWKDFKHTLKHNKEKLTLVELGSHLRIEESLKAQDSDKPKGNNVVGPQKFWFQVTGHVHFKRMQDMSKDGLIPDFDMDTEKCKRGIECIFIGYVEHFKAFRFFVIKPNKSVSTNSIIESKDANFYENRFSSVPRPSLSIPKGTKDIGGSVVPEKVTKEVAQDEVSDQRSYCFNVEDDPKIFDEAIKSQDVAFGKEAINDEMDSIMGNNTWVLVDLPPGCKLLGCKWIFKRKFKVDGTIEKLNARLVIQGFRRKSRIDYFDTYALVTHISTIRLLIAVTLIHNLIIHQMDVKTAFLNGELNGEHAPKQWHQKFNEVVLSNAYLLKQADKCVYSKFDESHKGVIICLYVDDMLIFGTNQSKYLSSRFSKKDMGEVDVILGIRIKHESNGIAISQSYYIEKVLKKFNYFDCTSVSTPMVTSEKLKSNNGHDVSQLEYSRVIGCLMYVMTCTWPDIAFALGKLSRYTSNPVTLMQAGSATLKTIRLPLLGGGAISWASKKQTCITGSTMKSKFVALADAGKEAEWLRNLILDIPLCSKPIAPISIRCDSDAILAKAYSQMYNGKSRHLDVRHSMIRELIMNGVISIEFVRSQQNLADHLTKGLARDLVIKSPE
ncbi:zinc finger, CCHC-type containing protein [Tanacetum coccineum]